MLLSLSIKNFALIDDLKVEWKPGLNVLTGETGAGKSILIDAISVLLGAKAGPTLIRSGTEKALIEGIFQPSPTLASWLKAQELIDCASEELAITREINKAGSRFRVNGTVVNQPTLGELKQFLLHIHAQHEARTLFSREAQLAMLDMLGDKNHLNLIAQVRAKVAVKKELEARLRELHISETERERRLDFGRFQWKELQDAQILRNDEDTELADQAQVLANVASLSASAGNAQAALVGKDADGLSEGPHFSALDSLQMALSEVERSLKLDAKLTNVSALLKSSLADVEEAASLLRKYHDSLETDPEALLKVESRIDQLATIKRKYGPTLGDALARQKALQAELEELENANEHFEEITHQLKSLDNELSSLADALSAKREALASKLSKRLESDLVDLGMERCRFQIACESLNEVQETGKDRVDFMICANPGQPLMPVSKIASGGELSRIMLAIKGIFAQADQVATVIFDEIDTGLSGRVLQAMRDKLAQLSRSHQILIITHQPMIAAIADNHLHVQKEQTAKSTKVSAYVLSGDARLKALAEMASGQNNEKVAISFAKSLLDQASKIQASKIQANQVRSN
jgi:DNA repair protein RecN (Recombination protein N)